MKMCVDEIVAQAMLLPGEDRAQLAEHLVESLEDETIEKLWVAEAKKRRDEIRCGQIEPIQGEAALVQVRKLVV